MKAFRYSALTAQGARVSRTVYAADPLSLRDQLLQQSIHPLWIRPALFAGRQRLSLTEAEAARLARDLAQLLGSGLALSQALGLVIARETPRVAAVATEIRDRLSSGAPLSRALEPIEGQAARFLQALARAGEASGRQAEVLKAGAASLASADQLKKRMLTLSLYPAFVILIAVGSIAVYAYAVLPSLEPAFDSFGDNIPPQTQVVLMFGAVIRTVMPIGLTLGLLGGLGLMRSATLRDLVRDRLARLVMRAKRSPLSDFLFAGLASRLSVMLGAGVPLAVSWRLAREPINVRSVAGHLAAQDARLTEGARLSVALAGVPGAPADLLHYVTLGEQSARTPQALSDAAVAMGGRAQETLERLLSIATPVVIVLVGAMVGVITMLVFQGLLAVGDAVST